MKIQVLDCTLRDGGFVNDWQFGHMSIINIYLRLAEAGIEILELGFLHDQSVFNLDRSMQPTTEDFNRVFDIEPKNRPIFTGMVILGECRIENIGPAKDSVLDAIRVVFKKQDIDAGIAYCKGVIERGYTLFVQPASVTDYSSEELADLAKRLNALDPYAVYIVDTYGLLQKKNLLDTFDVLARTLKPEIAIGYHAHNNFNLAYANATELLQLKPDRDIILDGTVYGMGKGAGNANTELLAFSLNNDYGKHYDLAQILEIINLEILSLKKKFDWGYSFDKFISAANRCHPKYVGYLVSKNTLPVHAINTILSEIPDETKTLYNNDLIETLYDAYLVKNSPIEDGYQHLKNDLDGKAVLVLCPGSSLVTHKAEISSYINAHHPVVVSANFFSRDYACDYIMVSNAKRFGQMIYYLKKGKGENRIITTTNVSGVDTHVNYTLNAEALKFEPEVIRFNSALIMIKVLAEFGHKAVTLAGFDGYETGTKHKASYLAQDFAFDKPVEGAAINQAVNQALTELKQRIDIRLLTPSVYNLD